MVFGLYLRMGDVHETNVYGNECKKKFRFKFNCEHLAASAAAGVRLRFEPEKLCVPHLYFHCRWWRRPSSALVHFSAPPIKSHKNKFYLHWEGNRLYGRSSKEKNKPNRERLHLRPHNCAHTTFSIKQAETENKQKKIRKNKQRKNTIFVGVIYLKYSNLINQ